MDLKALIACGMFALISCNDKDKPNLPVVNSHPMEIGTEWTYNHQVTLTKYESETSDNKIKTDTLNFTVKVWIEKDTILNNDLIVKVFKSSANNENWHLIEYKFIDEEGLKTYAHSNFEESDNNEQQNSFLKSLLAHGGLITGGFTVESPPTLDIKLPLSTTSTWTYRYPSEPGSLQIDKTVIGYERIKLNKQSYNCYKVEWKYLNDPGFSGFNITDWISEKGLIKKLIINERVTIVSDEEDPLLSGNIQIIETLTLEQLTLNAN